MPYVDQQTRERLEGDPPNNHAITAGQLTYDIQQLLVIYLEDRGVSYQTMAECLGALEGAKADFANRVLTPYEERKRRDNGDVWPEEILKCL